MKQGYIMRNKTQDEIDLEEFPDKFQIEVEARLDANTFIENVIDYLKSNDIFSIKELEKFIEEKIKSLTDEDNSLYNTTMIDELKYCLSKMK